MSYKREIFGVFREENGQERGIIYEDLDELHKVVSTFQKHSIRAQLQCISAINSNIPFTYIGIQHIVEFYNGPKQG